MPSHPERVRRNQPEVNAPAVTRSDVLYGLREWAEKVVRDKMLWVSEQDARACPRCAGPSTRGGICLNCLRTPDEPTAETPWGV